MSLPRKTQREINHQDTKTPRRAKHKIIHKENPYNLFTGILRLCSGLVVCAFLFCGCSGGTSGSDGVGGIFPAQDVGELTNLEEIIYTDAYDGYLVVILNEVKDPGINKAKDPGKSASQESVPGLAELEQIVNSHPGTELNRSISVTKEEHDARRAYLEQLSGKKLQDFNLIYHVTIEDPDEAVRTMRDLANSSVVDKVYPRLKFYVSSIATVPDLTGEQDYLYADGTHGGLNAQAAWDVGVDGDGITIADCENEWNFDHEDLNLTWGVDNWAGVLCYPTPVSGCLGDMAHGTAVAGIISSLDNGHGTKGFAPLADLKANGETAGDFTYLVDGVGRELSPGSIILVEVQHAGALSSGSCSGFTELDQYGCVPISVVPDLFSALEYVVAAGITVIEGSGNGSISLDDPSAYRSTEITLFDHDTGSIIVGGSQGSNHQKISFSNYGAPVDSYAWAAGVVTTAYPYGGSTGPYYWDTISGPNPPNDDDNAYFTNRFGGTSSAAAMVAGAATLIQGYAKDVMGEKRYLMPNKMREIITSTGRAQVGGGGNIGTQPRIDQAMDAVDTFWTTATSAYPELSSGGRLTVSEVISLRALGVGLICLDRDLINSDPACPEDDIFIPGSMIAKSLDFDGDGRADLVSWTNGQWKIDLSSVGTGEDNFGDWDTIINYPATDSRWVWPYVEDYNTDGRSDLAVYDKENGIWYITFTNASLLGTGMWPGWDWEIDYSSEWVDTLEMDPWNSQYSRPAPGDYNGDGWMDIAIACSDGYWRIDYGGPEITDYGSFENNFRYLTSTELTAAPGWAYLTTTGQDFDSETGIWMSVAYKVPDGITNAGKMTAYSPRSMDPTRDAFRDVTLRFGGNDSIPSLGKYECSDCFVSVGLKENSGNWDFSFAPFGGMEDMPPIDIYGGLDCRPVSADFDGDDIEDRAVMCPDEWRIAYSGDIFDKSGDDAKHVGLTYNTDKFTLPGRSYSGGISYEFVQQLIAYAQEVNPTEPPPIPVDMASTSVCMGICGD